MMHTISATRGSVRKVDTSGIVRWAGVAYECPEWRGRWVIVKPLATGLGLQDERTKERRVARRLEEARS